MLSISSQMAERSKAPASWLRASKVVGSRPSRIIFALYFLFYYIVKWTYEILFLGKQFSTPFSVSPVYNNCELSRVHSERTSEEIHINNFITSWGVSDW